MRTGTGADMNAAFCLRIVSAVSIAWRKGANIGAAALSSSTLGVQQFDAPPVGATRSRFGSGAGGVMPQSERPSRTPNPEEPLLLRAPAIPRSSLPLIFTVQPPSVATEPLVDPSASPDGCVPAARTAGRGTTAGCSDPSAPDWLSPQPSKRPSASRINVASPPAATVIALALVGSAICTGRGRLAVPPSHSCDLLLFPHVQTLPSARTATPCHVPAAKDWTPLSPLTNVEPFVVPPFPS